MTPRFPDGGPWHSVVTSDYFRTIGTSVQRGRGFTDAEDRVTSRVVVVNRNLANAYWPGLDPIGRCVYVGRDSTCSQVVGVVGSTMFLRVIREERAMFWLPAAHPAAEATRAWAVVLRAGRDPRSLVERVRRDVQAIAPEMPYVNVDVFRDRIEWQLRSWRLGATMFSIFGAIALTIAAVGLYSVMAYGVAHRMREIGVRMALGAQPWHVIRLVTWQGSRAVAIGLLAGGGAAWLGSRWIGGMLYETSARDPLVYAVAALTLGAAGILAGAVPAWRSTTISPAVSMRAE